MTEVMPALDLSSVRRDDHSETAARLTDTTIVHGEVTIPGSHHPVPYTVEIPYDLRTDAAALLVPGFGAIKRHSRLLRNEVAAQGIPTISFGAARRRSKQGNRMERLFDPQKLHHDTIAGIIEDLPTNPELRQAPHAGHIRDAKIALVPHSMGGLSAASYAARNHDAIDSVIHISTVGAEGPLGVELVKRTLEELVFDIAPAIVTGKFGYSLVIAGREAKYFSHDVLRTVGEIISCLRADTKSDIAVANKADIYQAYVGLTQDRFFHSEDAMRHIGELLNYVELIDCGHIGPQTQARLVGRTVGSIIINKPTDT